MEFLGPKLRSAEGGRLMFWCPGCDEAHTIRVSNGQGGGWTYNANPEAPTFSPSVLVTSGHYMPAHPPGKPCWCTFGAKDGFQCFRCHSFVRDGRIEFLPDSTHALAGQTVPLPDFPR
ncbi:ammonia monooxygenase [Xanthobacter autotrophicus]|uniref:DUF6527 family protein n=1 Tax=Xanthobacter TaxID=279 RepID=UPI0024ABBC46|nr:DUF6527 family protein [Xanthobacter autotrophicus]MDI4666585.1 ammonia monooxygenase [Xanthobacter autotrophicus]